MTDHREIQWQKESVLAYAERVLVELLPQVESRDAAMEMLAITYPYANVENMRRKITGALHLATHRIIHPPISWQPMEIAPRDGTSIIVIDADGEVMEGSWNTLSSCWINSKTGYAIDEPTLWTELPPKRRRSEYDVTEHNVDIDAVRMRLNSGFTGDIAVGDHFIWQKDIPRAWAHIIVTKIDTVDSKGYAFDERRIWTRVIHGSTNRPGSEAWNEEDHFRESVTPCDKDGTVIK